MLERAGEIELPAVRWRIVGQRRTARPRPEAVLIDTTPLTMPLGALGPIEIQLVRRTADEPLFHSLMEQFHYLRYEQPVGEHLKYLVYRFNQTYSHKNVCDTLGPWRASPSVRGWLCPLRNESNFKNCAILKRPRGEKCRGRAFSGATPPGKTLPRMRAR